MLRTVNQLRLHNVSALSWWTFSSIFEEGNLPTNEFGPFGANSALQTVHGVPLPIYRGFQLLADAGDWRRAWGVARDRRSRGERPPAQTPGPAMMSGTCTMDS